MNTLAPQLTKFPASAPQASASGRLGFCYLLFFLSGFPALLYQVLWQRALFTLYGVNIESVTMIVSVFMLGLGLGSLAGGWLSTKPRIPLLLAFGIIELSVGAFGACSLGIFHRVGALTAGAPVATVGLLAFALLLIPTMLMGSTLPLLVAHFVRRTSNVGESVGSLYSVNTLGSGAACLFAAMFLMRMLGQSGSVRLAASLNAFIGLTALLLHIFSRNPAADKPEAQREASHHRTIPFRAAMLLAAASGFIALAYEIVWYRLYSFTSGGTAPCFAKLLAFYLFGIAYGSFAVRDVCRKKLRNDLPATLAAASNVVVLGTIAAFLVGPALSFVAVHLPYEPSFTFVFIASALLGAVFPLIAHAAIGPAEEAGRRVSLLYLSNILGSTLGSFLVGFVFLNFFSTRATSLMLLGLGLTVAIAIAILARPIAPKRMLLAGCLTCAGLALCSGPLFSNMYERLLFKSAYTPKMKFADVAENRSGVITVTSNGTVFGGGAYDGWFNTDPVHDSNEIFRAFVISGLHPHPKKVLIIGLSSGSWAQVLANAPGVEDVTIIEINPGYLPLIRKHPEVSSLLRNPKVHFAIDDGRRWLVSHPDQKFDFILMNTTFHWRANASNLLSLEFLGLIRKHLNAGGIEYYNTTWSNEAQATGASAFPYALRIAGFLAVSDSPFTLDKQRWRTVLTSYKIDGRLVFQTSNPLYRSKLVELLHRPDGMLESRESILARCKGLRVITDGNMGTEWR